MRQSREWPLRPLRLVAPSSVRIRARREANAGRLERSRAISFRRLCARSEGVELFRILY